MKKIRTLVAHENENVANEIVESVNKLDFVEVVGTAKNEEETTKKIIDLKPEIVFADNEIGIVNMFEKSKQILKNETPIFNLITKKEITEQYVSKVYSVFKENLNCFLNEPINSKEIQRIMKDYQDYKELK